MSELDIQSIVSDIYAEGDIDLLFFGFITGYVSYDADDNSYDKSNWQVFEDTVKLIEYLITTGDFVVGRMYATDDGVEFVAYANGFTEFESVARQYMCEAGLRCDALSWELALCKVHIGKAASAVPELVGKLLRPSTSS